MKLYGSDSWLSVFNAILLLAFLAGQIPPCALAQEDQEQQQPLEEGDKVANPIPDVNATASGAPTDVPIEAQTPAPTNSPTYSPTNSQAPTKTPTPTYFPTASQPPTWAPTITFEPTPTQPTYFPTASQPPTWAPTVTPAPTISSPPTWAPTATFRPTESDPVPNSNKVLVPDSNETVALEPVPSPVSNNDETIELEPEPLPTNPVAIENDANPSISGGHPSPYSRESLCYGWRLGSMGIVTMVLLFGM